MNNAAMFPIQFKVAKLNTQFMQSYPPKKEHKVTEVTIPPHGNGRFDDYSIEIRSPVRRGIRRTNTMPAGVREARSLEQCS